MSAPNDLWYVGVLLEILSTMSGTIGKQLIRSSELRKRSNPAAATLAFYLGISVNTVVGPIVDMAAYSFAPQSLIAPFGGLDVVWNAILAPYFLRESLTYRRAAGCALIVVGTALAGGFGNHTDPEYTVEYLEETLVNTRVAFYFVFFLLWFIFNRFCLMRAPVGSAIRGVSLGCTAGTIAGNMFCVKAAVELIQRSIHELDGEIWLHWLPYVMLIGSVFFALSNVIYMTKGLSEYEALFMVTIYEGSMIVSGCVSGAVVLLDLRSLQAWRIVLYFFGVSVIVLGMYVVFSQEAMSKSSLVAGKASIELQVPDDDSCPLPSNTSPTIKLNRSLRSADMFQRSPHAKPAILDALTPSRSKSNEMFSDISSKEVLPNRGCFSEPTLQSESATLCSFSEDSTRSGPRTDQFEHFEPIKSSTDARGDEPTGIS